MKLWHDDVRPAPEGWNWARTNDEAKRILETDDVIEASLDHDMGYAGPPPGPCEPCGGVGSDAESDWYCAACGGKGFISDDVWYVAGASDDDGTRLVEWMCATGHVPPKITIHSWNPAGARRMAEMLTGIDPGHRPEIIVEPYRLGGAA